MIELGNVNKYYGTHHVLKDINLCVKEGEKLAIIGPSGSGKGTTIRCMNGLGKVSSGEVVVNSLILNHKNKIEVCGEYCAVVSQHFNPYPYMTVLQNLTLAPIELQKKLRQEAEETACQYLKVAGLIDKANVYPVTLSGGQQQRVAITRALRTKKPYILLDKPTSAPDPETIQEVLDVMKEISTQGNTTMVAVAHEISFAKEVVDRITFMEDDVIVEENVPSKFFSSPKTERVRLFLGEIFKN